MPIQHSTEKLIQNEHIFSLNIVIANQITPCKCVCISRIFARLQWSDANSHNYMCFWKEMVSKCGDKVAQRETKT